MFSSSVSSFGLDDDGGSPEERLERAQLDVQEARAEAEQEAVRADPNLRDPDGNTVLMTAVFKSESAVVEQLLAAGADPNLRNPDGMTVLMLAADLGPGPGRQHGADVGRR